MQSLKRNISFFLSGQAISVFGSMLVQYAIMWHITLKTQSAAAMTIYVIVGVLPMFFISPFAGVWADRYDRKRLIILADGLIAVVSLLVAVVLSFGYNFVWLLFIAAALRAFGQGVQMPAITAFIPQITPEQHLSKTNGFNSSIQSFVRILSPMAGGALLTFMPLQTLFFIDVVTAAIGISLLYFFVKPIKIDLVKEKIKTTYFKDIKEGFKYLYQHKFIWQLVLISALIGILICPAAFLTPLQVTRDFGKEVWRLTAIEIVFSGGVMLGGMIVGLWGGFKKKMYSLALAVIVCGIFIITLGLTNNFWLYCVAMFLTGLFIPLYETPEMVLLQTKTDKAYMGRVMSVYTMSATLIMPLAMLIYGPLGDIVSIDILLIVSGILMALLCLPLLMSKTLRKTI